MSKKATIADQVLALLSEGDKWADEIVAGVSAQSVSIRMCLCQLVKEGEIVRVKRGIYRKKEVLETPGAEKNTRKHLENVETINQMLNLYDKVLDDIALKIETEPLRVHALLLQFGGLPLFLLKDGGFCLVHTTSPHSVWVGGLSACCSETWRIAL